jgi:maleate cis-trans isomerase
MEEFLRLMPDDVGVVPLHVGVREGTDQEFMDALAIAEKRVAKLAGLGVDLILISGAPPFVIRGVGSDTRAAKDLEEKYGVPVLTATIAQVEAFRAMGIRSMVGITYSAARDRIDTYAKFFEDSGFEVRAFKGYAEHAGAPIAFSDAGKISPQEIYAFAKKVVLNAGGADAVYMLGAGWRNLSTIEPLEQDLGLTVFSSVPCQVWATQKRLHIRAPRDGYGRLMREMP